ncbi:hypothetical protein AVEN_13473-1 [Araneus ventricosus]|uniref:Uncharacterized protein n=1 Tax=Araneus ventricosus TaxID=182803 RepID=A0A4Y2IVD4_ARAVE|nr:hypothetical protein AVEN_13473-1 [Araneus ventricosus]
MCMNPACVMIIQYSVNLRELWEPLWLVCGSIKKCGQNQFITGAVKTSSRAAVKRIHLPHSASSVLLSRVQKQALKNRCRQKHTRALTDVPYLRLLVIHLDGCALFKIARYPLNARPQNSLAFPR